MTFNVNDVTLRGEEKLIGECCLSFSANGMLLLMTPDGASTRRLFNRAHVEWMQAAGMMITAFREIAPDKQGRRRYEYVELYCAYTKGGA